MIMLCITALLFSLTGCSWSRGKQEVQGSLRVGLIADKSPVAADGIDRTVWETLQQLSASAQTEIEALYRIPGQDGTFEECIQQLAEQECNLVICTDRDKTQLMVLDAQNAPQRYFAVFSDQDFGLDNLCSLSFDTHQAVYLGGYAAGKATQSSRIACVYNHMTEQVEQYLAAFQAGVKAANKEALLLRSNLLLRGDVRTTQEMVANGVDVVFHIDGQAESKVVSTCRENGIWAVTANAGGLPSAAVLASAQDDFAFAVTNVVQQTAAGQFASGLHCYNLAGGVTLLMNPDQLPESIQTSVENMKNKIIAGEVTIPVALDETDD